MSFRQAFLIALFTSIIAPIIVALIRRYLGL